MESDAPEQQPGASGDFVSRIETKLLRTRKVLIFGDIHDRLASDVCSRLLLLAEPEGWLPTSRSRPGKFCACAGAWSNHLRGDRTTGRADQQGHQPQPLADRDDAIDYGMVTSIIRDPRDIPRD